MNPIYGAIRQTAWWVVAWLLLIVVAVEIGRMGTL